MWLCMHPFNVNAKKTRLYQTIPLQQARRWAVGEAEEKKKHGQNQYEQMQITWEPEKGENICGT